MKPSSLFNIEIVSDNNNLLEKIANTCLSPVRYLFSGRTYKVLNEKVMNSTSSFSNASWRHTALAILTLIPGLIIGVPAKLISSTSSITQKHYELVSDYSSPSHIELQLPSREDLFNLDLIYNPEEFSYSLPRNILENFLKGTAFDHKEEYTSEEKEALHNDIYSIYSRILRESPLQEKTAIMTAGAPGAGKTTLLRQDRESNCNNGRTIAYICPDDICLKQMEESYLKELNERTSNSPSMNEEEEKQLRLEMYNKWRPASNGATHLILAHLIRQNYAFYFGTTSTGPATSKFFEFLKDRGYEIELLHVSAENQVRWNSIKERDKTFIQTTEEDINEKGILLPQRIHDYLNYASNIKFYFREQFNANAQLAATWIRNPEGARKSGTLTIQSRICYQWIKNIHDATCNQIGCPDLCWEKTVSETSDLPAQEI